MEKSQSMRKKYEEEALIIKNKLGSLREIQDQLQLSGRKMSQLLLIDPSTWTRWIKNQVPVPPSVFRSLQWYMALIEKHPEWHPLNTYFQNYSKVQNEDWEKQRLDLEEKYFCLVKKQKNDFLFILFLVGLNIGLFIYLLIKEFI